MRLWNRTDIWNLAIECAGVDPGMMKGEGGLSVTIAHKAWLLGRSGGMPPPPQKNILNFRPSEIASGAVLGQIAGDPSS